jgi:hypothetical protein
MSAVIFGARFASSGKRFFEIVPESIGSAPFRPSVGISGDEEAYPFGLGLSAVSIDSDGNIFESNEGYGQEQTELGFSFVSGDVVGVAIDFDTSATRIYARFYINGAPILEGSSVTLDAVPNIPYRAAVLTNYGQIQFHLRATAAQLGDRIPEGYTPWEDS